MIASKDFNADKVNGYKEAETKSVNQEPSPFQYRGTKQNPATEKGQTKNGPDSIENMFSEATQTLKENLAQYARTYKETGHIDFVGAEIVAQMANEGEVLVPDQAERLMRKIHTTTQKVQQFTLQLRAALQSESSYKSSPSENVRLTLLNLSRETTVLLMSVELHVVPLAEVVKESWKLELLRLISALKSTLDGWLQLLSQEADELRAPQVDRYHSVVRQSLLFSSKISELRIRSLEVIMKRVPLYRVLY